MSIKRKNLFCYTKEKERTFKLVKKITDLKDNPYILKFRDCHKKEFFLMFSEFKDNLNKGKIIFSED